ncbi:MAG: tRNA 2-thiouridine(34) synthase MnmA, partial [Candidatus Paceibacteria bacterium]
MAKKTVFVGLSGGVDSAVSALLLKQKGYKVVGVFIQTWHPDFIACNEEEERRDAMRVAAHLDIPFLTLDLSMEYKRDVAHYMIEEYRNGRTPNPDVLCNSHIKFGGFLNYALSRGADFVATGHYAQRKDDFLVRAVDSTKDQVYFLWQLTQKQLEKIIFPIGALKKTEVRKIAKKYKLPISDKKDSQGICFLGDIDLKDFLQHYIETKKGEVLNEMGEVVGEHD